MASSEPYPGQPRSFHFDKYSIRQVNGESIIIFNAYNIRIIKGTMPDKHGKELIYMEYKGPVRMKKSLASDAGFRNWARQPNISIEIFSITKPQKRARKQKPFKPPQDGNYIALSMTNLFMDIDAKGHVWLTDKTFYELNLLSQLDKLNTQFNTVLSQIKSIQEELQNLEFAEGMRQTEIQREIEEQSKKDEYYISLQDELSQQEISRMKKETDGFFDID